MKKQIEHLIKSMMDGLKDSNMYYEYAKCAKEHGYPDLSTYFIMRAKTRIQMFNEDYVKVNDTMKKLENETGEKMEKGKWDCLHEHIMEEKDKIDYLISTFK